MKKLFILYFCIIPHAYSAIEIKANLINFNEDEQEKIQKAIEIIKRIVPSEEFKNQILNYEYKGSKRFKDNNGLSNEEILQKIFDGAEMLKPEKNGVMDLELELITEDSKTIGYTYPNTNRIWINKKYFVNYTPMQVADNLLHEWMHKLGFDHEHHRTKDRHHSVPYAIGYILENLAYQAIISDN